MTKKDYELIAGAIHRSIVAASLRDKNANNNRQRNSMARLIITDLAATLRHDNAKFDTEKFLQACGY